MPDDPLLALGWRDHFAEAFASSAAEGLVPARVALEHTHIYRVFTATGEPLARVSGRLRHQASTRVDFPGVGDWVAVEPTDPGADTRIVSVLPRFSRFSRRAAGDPTEEQIVAANIDTVFLVAGLDGDFNPRRIERYLLVAWESGATPVVVLNKADVVDDAAAFEEEVRAIAPGVAVHAVSCRAGDGLSVEGGSFSPAAGNSPFSLDRLRAYLGFGRTGALLGSSGVGKSSIVNRLVGRDLLRTSDVRAADSRGRHTSTARQLVPLPGGGLLIDTPGMRELQLWDGGEARTDAFADIEARAADCRFRDCGHRSEPGCAVRTAVAAGEIPAIRLESYHKLADEMAHQVRQQDQRAQLEEKRRGKVASKALQRRLRDKGRI